MYVALPVVAAVEFLPVPFTDAWAHRADQRPTTSRPRCIRADGWGISGPGASCLLLSAVVTRLGYPGGLL